MSIMTELRSAQQPDSQVAATSNEPRLSVLSYYQVREALGARYQGTYALESGKRLRLCVGVDEGDGSITFKNAGVVALVRPLEVRYAGSSLWPAQPLLPSGTGTIRFDLDSQRRRETVAAPWSGGKLGDIDSELAEEFIAGKDLREFGVRASSVRTVRLVAGISRATI